MCKNAIILVLCCLASARAASGIDYDQGFISLCYHDVVLDRNDYQLPDTMPTTLKRLVDHFDWLRDGGYNVIGVDDILADRAGERPLPEKAVLLSFDDGYASFHRFIFPLLKAYNYKAVMALQTGWLSTPDDAPVVYSDAATLPRSYFITWEEAKEMADSGLVELASHSHDLHRNHPANPQGSMIPVASSLAYDPETKTYEDPEALYKRVHDDLKKSADLIEEKTGRRPRVAVWPYGHYNQPAVKAAKDAGYELTASLGLWADGDTFARTLVYNDQTMYSMLHDPARGFEPGNSRDDGRRLDSVRTELVLPVYPLERVAQVDLDMIYDPDPAQLEKNVSSLYQRLEALQITTVYLQAYADPDGNGTADALYFPNRHLPTRADLFSYVAWGLRSRLLLNVYAWMPVLGFEIPGRPLVRASGSGNEGSTYARLTPFDAENQRIVKEIYTDLARHAKFAGVVFHDDAVLGDYEDAGESGLAWMEANGLPASIDAARGSRSLFKHWTRLKSEYLTAFTKDIVAAMEQWSPPLETSRNMYAQAVLNPDAEEWYAQNFENFLANYDRIGLMAMPYMENEDRDPDGWLVRLAEKVKAHPLGRQKVVFELQSVDWRDGSKIPTETLAKQFLLLQENGIGNLGYYPDDPPADHPEIDVLYPAFSLSDSAYARVPYPPEPPDTTPSAPNLPPAPEDVEAAVEALLRGGRMFPVE